jgi:hypothetical protein
LVDFKKKTIIAFLGETMNIENENNDFCHAEKNFFLILLPRKAQTISLLTHVGRSPNQVTHLIVAFANSVQEVWAGKCTHCCPNLVTLKLLQHIG